MTRQGTHLVRVPLNRASCWIDLTTAQRLELGDDRGRIASLVQELLDAADQGRGVILKNDRHSRVCRVEVQGRSWVVKRYPHRNKLLKMRTYHLLRQTLAWREWRGCRRLAAAGIRTTTPLAIVHDASHPAERLRQHLVFPFIAGRSLDQVLRETATTAHRLEIARAVGMQVGLLSAAGWRNADLKPTNLLIDAVPLPGGQPVMIDPTSIRLRRSARAALSTLGHLLHTSLKTGTISPREGLTCLAAAVEQDPSLRRSSRCLSALARRIARNK